MRVYTVLTGLALMLNIAHAQIVHVQWTNPEGQITYLAESVWANLDRWMKPCLLESARCGLSSAEIKILEQNIRIFPEEKKKTLLEVVPIRLAPGTFDQNGGSPRVAITGNRPFAPIYMNMDAMVDNVKGNTMPRSQVISFLVHEISHHQGIGDTDERLLDKIGNAVAQNFKSNSESINLATSGMPMVGAYLHNVASFDNLKRLADKKDRVAQIGLDFGMATWDYRENLIAEADEFDECRNQKMQLMHASNLRWYKLPSRFEPGAKLSVITDLRILCGTSISGAKEIKANFLISGNLVRKQGKLVIDWETQAAGISKITMDDNKVAATDVSITMNTKRISGGGTWSGKAIVTLNKDIPIKRCVNGLGADHFMKHVSGEMVPFGMVCTLRKLGPAQYEAEVKYQFTSSMKSATYYLTTINFVPEDTTVTRFNVVPAVRQSVELVNSGAKAPILHQIRMYDKNTVDVTDKGLRDFKPGDTFSIVVWIKNYSQVQNFQFDSIAVDHAGSAGRHYALFLDGKTRDPNLNIQEHAQNGMMAIALTYKPKVNARDNYFTVKKLEIFDANLFKTEIPLGKEFTIWMAR